MNTRYDERWSEKAPGRSLVLAGRLLVVLATGAALAAFGLIESTRSHGLVVIVFLGAAVFLAVGGALWAAGHDQARPAPRSAGRVYRL